MHMELFWSFLYVTSHRTKNDICMCSCRVGYRRAGEVLPTMLQSASCGGGDGQPSHLSNGQLFVQNLCYYQVIVKSSPFGIVLCEALISLVNEVVLIGSVCDLLSC